MSCNRSSHTPTKYNLIKRCNIKTGNPEAHETISRDRQHHSGWQSETNVCLIANSGANDPHQKSDDGILHND